jgi:hypothetical protein
MKKQIGGLTNKTTSEFDFNTDPSEQGFPYASLDSAQRLALSAYGLQAANVKSWAPFFSHKTFATGNIVSSTSANITYDGYQWNLTAPTRDHLLLGFFEIVVKATNIIANVDFQLSFIRQLSTGTLSTVPIIQQAFPTFAAPAVQSIVRYSSTRTELAMQVQSNILADAAGTFNGTLYGSFEGIIIFPS